MPWTGNILEETLVASAARSADGSVTGGENYSDVDSLRVQLDVTAANGTGPSLAVFIEDSVDGANWDTIGSFAAKTAAGRETITLSDFVGRRLRVRWAITGTTPSFTFSVKLAAEA